jgi:hypothetical protein
MRAAAPEAADATAYGIEVALSRRVFAALFSHCPGPVPCAETALLFCSGSNVIGWWS